MARLPPGAILPQRALDIRAMRSDLSCAFDIRTRRGRSGLFWWYYLHGFREMGLIADPERDNMEALNQPYPGLEVHHGIPITWLMRALWAQSIPTRLTHADTAPNRFPFSRWLKKPHLPEDRETQAEFLQWYFTEGLATHVLTEFLTGLQAAALIAEDRDHPGACWLQAMIWRQDNGSAAQFRSPADDAFHRWCAQDGLARWSILAHPLLREHAGLVPPAPPSRPFGVNIFGHARGRMGISEDVRMAARTLETTNIPFVICNVDPSSGIAAEDDSLSHLFSDNLPYSINLFCMSGIETAALLRREPYIKQKRYSIGFWPWELPEWPVLWHHAYGLVDEIWAGSHFTRDAYLRSAPIPVSWQPMAVSVHETGHLDRASFDLPHDRFLFAFAFDGASSVARKNPIACLTAFQRAFPPVSGDAVGLVIKGLRADGDPAWQQLLDAARGDPRIHLIADSLPRSKLLDLYRAIDCFMSLHRSEGFGRNIAECMMLGKPVIATAHSGNMDFTTPETAALVPVRLHELDEGDYPFGNGQRWAEPDLDAAVRSMRRVYADPVWREALADRGRAFVTDRYESSRAAATWAQALHRTGARQPIS